MNKKEIELKISEECNEILPKFKGIPFDICLKDFQKELWRIADKYDTDGANVFNIIMKHFPEGE